MEELSKSGEFNQREVEGAFAADQIRSPVVAANIRLSNAANRKPKPVFKVSCT
jgi:hypothetical protein